MSGPLRGLVQRCWPQRIRIRLALVYAGLFLVAGSVLLGLTYGLVASSLPDQPASASLKTSNERAKLQAACKQARPDPGIIDACKQAFSAGATAGSQSQRQRALHNLLLFSLAGLAVMTVASGGAGWVVSGRVLLPVRTITETARRASEQHLGERLALTGPRDELKELADTFDAMLERLDRAFAAQRRFVANASHELRTPLTVMRTAIDVTLAKPGRTPEHLEDMAARVRLSIDRAESMISALLTLAVSDQGPAAREFADLATAAEDAVDAAAAGVERLGLRVETKLDPAETTGDPHLLERMVGNLVDNAVRHNEPGGWVRVRTGTDETTVFFEIANSGPLVPGEAVPSLFEPFRRLAGRTGARDGAGLGLSIAQSIASAHGATLSARSQPAGGLDIRVTLPRCLAAG
ncbi:MAG TPA: HAMP domain-containing sensor histidine kinase [Streptosporangiaceae bacterium]